MTWIIFGIGSVAIIIGLAILKKKKNLSGTMVFGGGFILICLMLIVAAKMTGYENEEVKKEKEEAAQFQAKVDKIQKEQEAKGITTGKSASKGSSRLATIQGDLNEFLSNYCAKVYPKNYNLRTLCIEQGRKAYDKLKAFQKPGYVTDEEWENITDQCLKIYPEALTLRVIYVERELEALKKLKEK